jgi:hypothetical protein
MSSARSFLRSGTCVKFLCFAAVILVTAFASQAQTTTPPKKNADEAWVQYFNKYPGLLDELIRLVNRLQHDVQYPSARSESSLLPLLPHPVFYAAIPNYGDAAHQSVTIFNDELRQSEVLRNWWQHSELAAFGPKTLDDLEKFSQFSQYLGPEIVISGAIEGKPPHATPQVTMLAQVVKPGLKDFLEQRNKELAAEIGKSDKAGKSKPPLRILTPQDLAAAEDIPPATAQHGAPATGTSGELPTQFSVLVRSDYVIASSNLAALKALNAGIERKSSEFASTAFGQRIAHAYAGGVTIVAAADLHEILDHYPEATKQAQQQFENSGFADMKYFVWQRKSAAGEAISEMDVSFTGPRRGAASWLAKPAPMGSIDFASPKAMMVGAAILTSPSQIFDDIQSLGGDSGAKAFVALGMFEQMFKLSLKEDFLAQLTGEFMIEMVNTTPPNPVWRTVFGVKNADHLQQAFHTLAAATQTPMTQTEVGGVTYYTIQIPTGAKASKSAEPPKPTEVVYAFAGGYLIAGSSKDAVADAIRMHQTGESLAKSQRFLEALPPGHESGESALFYQDSVATSALQLQPLTPEYARALEKLMGQSKAQIYCLYGDETSIHGASRSSGFDAGAIMMAAAIAIPNFMRGQAAGNQSVTVGNVRALLAAQTKYKSDHPERGYAPNLAALELLQESPLSKPADHAGRFQPPVGNSSCTGDVWCMKSGYRFIVKAECKKQLCDEFVVVAAPVAVNSNAQNYCATSDGVIRSKTGSPVTQPISAAECNAWSPLR